MGPQQRAQHHLALWWWCCWWWLGLGQLVSGPLNHLLPQVVVAAAGGGVAGWLADVGCRPVLNQQLLVVVLLFCWLSVAAVAASAAVAAG